MSGLLCYLLKTISLIFSSVSMSFRVQTSPRRLPTCLSHPSVACHLYHAHLAKGKQRKVLSALVMSLDIFIYIVPGKLPIA